MAKLPTLQLLFVILQLALLISKTFVFSQSSTQSAVDQSESNNQTDLNRKNQSSTFDSTTAATPMSENLTNSLSTADINLDENIFLYLNTESSSESIPTTTAAPEQPQSDPFDYNLFFCTCDLIGGECDVNCCCDPDCSQDDLRLFNGCWSPPSSYFDRYYCSPDPDRYGLVWNNTPEFRVQWSSRSGMFCIVTDNVPKKRLFKDRAPVTEDELLKQISPKLSGRWNDPESQKPSAGLEQWIYQPYYKQGSPIFTLHINGIVSVLSNGLKFNFFFSKKTFELLMRIGFNCNFICQSYRVRSIALRATRPKRSISWNLITITSAVCRARIDAVQRFVLKNGWPI